MHGEEAGDDQRHGLGGLEELLAGTERVKRPKQRQSIEDNADLARLSRKLATLRRDFPVEEDIEHYRLGDADIDAARRLFIDELECKNIIEQLPGYGGQSGGGRIEIVIQPRSRGNDSSNEGPATQ